MKLPSSSVAEPRSVPSTITFAPAMAFPLEASLTTPEMLMDCWAPETSSEKSSCALIVSPQMNSNKVAVIIDLT